MFSNILHQGHGLNLFLLCLLSKRASQSHKIYKYLTSVSPDITLARLVLMKISLTIILL